ncbi:MAG TPA: nickel transporter permease, partial [Thermodesulfobacteriota bacterium]|nr:nickel transporter permease [Thermodesulfobacteriota bacterium]
QVREVWRRLKRNRAAIVGGIIVILFVATAILAPWLSPYHPNEGDLTKRLKAPDREHLLGTDPLGRDVLSRVIYGARISLQIQIVAVVIAMFVGTILGMVGGYYGGTFDNLIMRLMDILLAFPGIFLAIAIIAVLGPGLTNLMLAAGIYSIPQFARIVRGSVLSLKEKEFVEAARAVGEKDFNILFRYLLPNSMAPIIVQTTLRMATVLLTASGLSFLGLGVQPPTPEWGAMLSNARAYLITAPHVATVPGLAIMMVVMGFNLFGDGLRDSLDPRLRD